MTMDFVCPDPAALVRAANVKATLDAFKLVPAIGQRIVEKHFLNATALSGESFIPLQRWLDAMKEIQTIVGHAKLRDVGRNVVQNAEIPAVDLEALLLNLDQVYYANHKGDVGHYLSSRRADGAIEVHCETPYPRNFEWGLIEGFVANKRATGGRRYATEFIDGSKTGRRTCTIVVRSLG